MTIAIYSIRHVNSDKRYIGKSKNAELRWVTHKSLLRSETRSKDCNRHLWNAVKKHGLSNFEFSLVEIFDTVDEVLTTDRELYWMDFYKTCDREFGYNLRRDSSTRMTVHDETLAIQRTAHAGDKNANYGNRWDDDMKSSMSTIAKLRHAKGRYGPEWKAKISKASTETWKNEELKAQMAAKVSVRKQKYGFIQYAKDGSKIKTWDTIKEIVAANPTYKWQNIYSVCNGYKNTYMGFIWRSFERDQCGFV